MAKESPTKRRTGDKKRRFPRPFGRYILEKSLSRGGMGEVYLAIVKQLNQRCVIKTIRGDLTGEQEFVGRFADEAKILVRAAHTNIIRYFDAGRVASDYYIAMEHVHGRDLGDVLDRAYERGEPMPPDIGIYIALNLLEGLQYAHDMQDERGRPMGLVHRDISPQNVMIGFDGSIKLIDFGLARTDVLPNRTQGALAVGKYGYMSPEQARHEHLDGRADIYSAGVMLFEVFTGDRLVDERDQATLWQRVLNPKHRNPRSVLPSLRSEIDRLVMKAVAIRPRERFPTARAMAEFATSLRGPRSTKKELLTYLKYLYPNVEFTPPPIPPLDDLADGVEKSIIYATSREGARSVFGRGELPIAGTMQVNAGDVRREIEKHRKLVRENRDSSAGPKPIITRPERGPLYAFKPTEDNPDQTPIDHAAEANHAARSIAAVGRSARRSQLEWNEKNLPATQKALLGQAGMSRLREDDQATVMMKGPPTTLYDSATRTAMVFDTGEMTNTVTDDLFGPTEIQDSAQLKAKLDSNSSRQLERLLDQSFETPDKPTDLAYPPSPPKGARSHEEAIIRKNPIPAPSDQRRVAPLPLNRHVRPQVQVNNDALHSQEEHEEPEEMSLLVMTGLVSVIVSVFVVIFLLLTGE